jgi:hypothetical protein
MPRYAPLPAVNIDPRNESQLVNEAAKRAYDASNAKLNDFSAGNPLMALIEGQAFAQGELLFWANQLPESILIEWIGPFLGAMRRLGTPSTTRLTVFIDPQQTQFLIPAGTEFLTDSNLTGGQAIAFVTSDDVVVAANETSAVVQVSSSLVGSFNNVSPNTITEASSTELPVISATNDVAAVGGSDVEPLDQTKERFFTLIRRRNPVSAQDWQDLFEDLFGVGTYTAVLPNRSSKEQYIWLSDYVGANGHISFFFLNPDGTEPTPDQVRRAQNVVDFSMPLEMQGHVYPINLSEVQYELDLSYEPTSEFAGFLRNYSLGIRDSLFQIMSPGRVFPAGYDASVSDINAALLETFPQETKYSEPDILDSRAYNTPLGVNSSSVINSQLKEFKTQENVFAKNDLLTLGEPDSILTESAWPVVTAYTPYSSEQEAQLLYGNLKLQKILQWGPGVYTQGQVVRNPGVENSLLVVLKNFENTNEALSPTPFILEGVLSSPKDFQEWKPGNTYYANNKDTGFYDPDVVAMDQVVFPEGSRCDRQFFEPPGDNNLYYRIGWYCYVVNQDFTLESSTNTTFGAQNQGLVSELEVNLNFLKAGGAYEEGTWIRTPAVGSGPDIVVDPYYYYVDITLGAIVKYAYVNKSFVFLPSAGKTLSESFDDLVADDVVSPVTAANGLISQPLFQYEPRFPPRVYLSYKVAADQPVQYYFSLTGFTPSSSDPSNLVAQGVVDRVDTDPKVREEFEKQIVIDPETMTSDVCPPLPMFVFSPGDATLFRQQGTIRSFVATKHFTPVFAPSVYIQSRVLIETNNVTTDAVPFFSVVEERPLENLILAENGKNFYRVMKFFTARSPVFNWDGQEVTDTARLEELNGNLLRIVNKYTCEENILAPNGPATSGNKLGVFGITFRAKNAYGTATEYIWENTQFFSEVPQLSYATSGKEVFQPVSYGDGTLAL